MMITFKMLAILYYMLQVFYVDFMQDTVMHKDSLLISAKILNYITARLNNHGFIYYMFVNIY
jgi:hypothetical protein